MKSVNIKGKEYVMVNERLSYFRANYKDWSLISEIVNLTDDSCVIKASVIDDKGIVRATGYAQEDKMSSAINKTSFVENCETSAWGRALGNLGIGIENSIASAEEVDLAIKKQQVLNSLNLECENCGASITEKVASFSKSKCGKELCYNCQQKLLVKEVEV